MPTGIYKRKKPNWNKGLKMPESTKKKISDSLRGRIGKKLSEETKEKLRQINLGKKHTDEARAKISKKMEGNKYSLGYKHPPEFGKKISERNLKMGIQPPHPVGEKHYNWQGGKSFESYSLDWTNTLRRSIRERDKYTCQICSEPQGDNAHDVHHIDYDKKNCSPENLITLCRKCHRKTNDNREYWTNYFIKIL